MESNELKFLLKLLSCANYRSSLSASTFDSFKKDKNKICCELGKRGLIDFSREIVGVKITSAGRTLLKMETTQLPIPKQDLKVLEVIAKASGKVAPSKITVPSIKAAQRDTILQSLAEKGLVEVETGIKKQKVEVWLTEKGQEYLRDDFAAKGTHPVISMELLSNYIRFLRKSLHAEANSVASLNGTSKSSSALSTSKLTDEEILQTIQNLDREFGTENYLPIFHLRQKLQPSLSRNELDETLYRLQRSEKIELSTLAEPRNYTSEQVKAGIPQVVGGTLFFIAVN